MDPKPKLKKGDRKFERGIWWTCTDPDIERWVGQGQLEPDYDAEVMFPGDRMSVNQFIESFGGVAEGLKAPVLKTGDGKLSVSSNLTASAKQGEKDAQA